MKKVTGIATSKMCRKDILFLAIRTKWGMYNHSKIHSKINTGKSPYHCGMYGKGLMSLKHTKRHMKSLARENLYQCVLCGNRIVETLNVPKIIKKILGHNL